MRWQEVRENYPHQWLLLEAIDAVSEAGKRIVDQLTVIQTFTDPLVAMELYKDIHQKHPQREFLVLHTDKETLDISERKWIGIRGLMPKAKIDILHAQAHRLGDAQTTAVQ